MKRAKIIIWSIIAVLLLVAVINYFLGTSIIRIAQTYTFAVISISAVTCIIWYFVGVFVKKTWKRILITSLMIVFCVFLYILDHRPAKVIYLEEDVLYIIPIPKTE
jgi:uncharacterized oligopeptide transporter (OPT) family protein